MSPTASMTEHVRSYLSLRRAFGFRLSIAGEMLQKFATFADSVAPGEPFSVNLALRWAQSSPTGKQVSAARRMLILRPFARYLLAIAPLTEVPPNRILGPAQYRYVPHIYSDEQIRELLDAAGGLRPRGGVRAQSMQTYLALLACTGMRPPEPLRLSRGDVDFSSHTITVRQTKFSKSRIVVLHPTATKALQKYAHVRDRCVRDPRSSVFFLSDDGSAFTHKKALWAFCHLRQKLGWSKQPGRRYPRLYDLRHTFVCRRLLAWHRGGIDVQVRYPRSRLIWAMSTLPILIGT